MILVVGLWFDVETRIETTEQADGKKQFSCGLM